MLLKIYFCEKGCPTWHSQIEAKGFPGYFERTYIDHCLIILWEKCYWFQMAFSISNLNLIREFEESSCNI